MKHMPEVHAPLDGVRREPGDELASKGTRRDGGGQACMGRVGQTTFQPQAPHWGQRGKESARPCPPANNKMVSTAPLAGSADAARPRTSYPGPTKRTCLHTVQMMDMALRLAPSCDVLPFLAPAVALRSRLVLDLAPLPPPMAAGRGVRGARPRGRKAAKRGGREAAPAQRATRREEWGGD